MSPFLRLVLLLVFGLMLSPPLLAQNQRALADTLLTWRTYAQESSARVRIFAATDERRPRTVVVDELANNAAGVVTDDARFLAETVGRLYGFDPAEATFVFRFSAASFTAGAAEGRKMLLVRAAFGRTKTGGLAAPAWRVISRGELDELTARALY
jgi:hypothetical protein